MTEQELLDQLETIEYSYLSAKRKLIEIQKQYADIETLLIELKINKEKLTEELRVFRKTNASQPLSLRDLEIEKFRKNNPELCQWASERDKPKEK